MPETITESRFEQWCGHHATGLIVIHDPALLAWFGWEYPPPSTVGANFRLWLFWAGHYA